MFYCFCITCYRCRPVGGGGERGWGVVRSNMEQFNAANRLTTSIQSPCVATAARVGGVLNQLLIWFLLIYVMGVEICLLTHAKRVASVRAETYCNLFSLSVEHFTAVLVRYPAMRKAMQTMAAQRLHGIGEDPTQVYRQPSMSSLFYVDTAQTTSQVQNTFVARYDGCIWSETEVAAVWKVRTIITALIGPWGKSVHMACRTFFSSDVLVGFGV